MSLYADLLRQVVDSEAGIADRPLPDLIAIVLARRTQLAAQSADPGAPPSPSRLRDALSYDAALIHLCDRLHIRHDLLEAQPGPAARHSAEQQLAHHLPALAPTLAGGQ